MALLRLESEGYPVIHEKPPGFCQARSLNHTIDRTTPPSTRSEAPLVAELSGLAT